MVVGKFDILPSEYWGMTPNEVWAIVEAKRPKTIDGIQEDKYYSMIRRRKELEAQGIEVL